jgi:hypothetical protein
MSDFEDMHEAVEKNKNNTDTISSDTTKSERFQLAINHIHKLDVSDSLHTSAEKLYHPLDRDSESIYVSQRIVDWYIGPYSIEEFEAWCQEKEEYESPKEFERGENKAVVYNLAKLPKPKDT